MMRHAGTLPEDAVAAAKNVIESSVISAAARRIVLAKRLKKRSALLFVLVTVLAAPAQAQEPAAESTGQDPFCSPADADLLTSLDGAWTLKQGAPTILPTPLPLPAPSPITVVFEYQPDSGEVYARAADSSGDLFLVPAGRDLGVSERELVERELSAQASKQNPNCDWSDLLTLVGSNFYYQRRLFKNRDYAYNLHPAGFLTQLCYLPPIRAQARLFCEEANDREGARVDEGELQMTLVLRFPGPDSGSGMVYFTGEESGMRYLAFASVEVSRN